MEFEIVMFVVKGSALLTLPIDRSRSKPEADVLLSVVTFLKLSGIHLTKIILKIWIIN